MFGCDMPKGTTACLVLVEQVLGGVGHASGVVLDAKGVLRPLWGGKARVLHQARPQCVGQVLHHSQQRETFKYYSRL